MSYEKLKKLNINLKDLTIKYAYSSSNVRDYRDRMVITEVEKNFNSKKELEDFLLGIVSGHFDGCTRVSRSLTLYKRIQYLKENNLIENGIAKDTEEVRQILTGEKKVKVKQFILASEVYVLKSTKMGVQLLYKTPKAKPTKFFKSELEEIKQQYKVFLTQYKIKEVEAN